MSFLRKGKNRKRSAPVKQLKKRKVTPVEMKLLAIDALKAELPERFSKTDPYHGPIATNFTRRLWMLNG